MAVTRKALLSSFEKLLDLYEDVRGHHCKGQDSGKAIQINVKIHNLPDVDDIFKKYREEYKENAEALECIDHQEKYLSEDGYYNYLSSQWDYAKEYFVERCACEKGEEQYKMFHCINSLLCTGRSGGWMLLYLDWDYDDLDNAYAELVTCDDMDYYWRTYSYQTAELHSIRKNLEYIIKEVEQFKNGVASGWRDEVDHVLESALNDLEEVGA